MNRSLKTHALLLALIAFLIGAVYYPGLTGGYVMDDGPNIVEPAGIAMQELSWLDLQRAATSLEKRPISRASFGLNYLATGFDPYYFKLTNIVIHALNAFLVYFISLYLLQQYLKSNTRTISRNRLTLIVLAITLSWSLHPVNLTSVLYVVQRMNSLSSLFVLTGILSYLHGRIKLDTQPLKGWILILLSPLLFLPLAWYSKENGGLLLLFLFIIELVFFRFQTKNKSQKKGLYLFYFFFLLLPSVFVIFYLIEHPGLILGGYGNRHFSLAERLMTESRILWLYIRMILLPSPSLFGLFLDDISISTSLITPMSTLPAITGLFGLILIALYSIKRVPLVAFGLLFFFVGHVIESTVIPLELAFEHRNYLPSFGLLLPLFYYLGFGLISMKINFLRTVTVSLIVLLLATQTNLRARVWSSNTLLYLTNVEYHPNSPRANYEAGKIYGQMLERGQGDTEINYKNAVRYLERSSALRKSSTSGLFGLILASIDSGNPVQEKWLAELEYRLSTQPLDQVNIVWLDRLTGCIAEKKCNKDDLRIPALTRAAINYPLVDARNKARLYSILAKYAYSVELDPLKSVEMSRIAVSLMPSTLYHQIILVNFLIATGQKTEAKIILDDIEKNDTYRQHEEIIKTLRKNFPN